MSAVALYPDHISFVAELWSMGLYRIIFVADLCVVELCSQKWGEG